MLDVTKTMEVVSVLDPALDREKMDVAKYAETRDPSLIKEKPGAKAARFELKPISTSIFLRIVEVASAQSEKDIRAFQVAVSSVKNLTLRHGQVVPDWRPNDKMKAPSGGDQDFISEEALSEFLPAVVAEVGAVAYQVSFLGQASGATYRVAPMLAAGLAALSRSAE